MNWKIRVCLALVILSARVTIAQSVTFAGVVTDEKGIPIASASVLLKGTNAPINTDLRGYFTINIEPNTILIITAAGYDADTLNTGTGTKVSIVLNKSGRVRVSGVPGASTQENAADPTGTARNESMAATIHDFENYQNTFNGPFVTSGYSGNTELHMISNAPLSNFYSSSALPEFKAKENTRGSRYFFDRWVGGVVLDSGNNLIANKNYLFNYDKMGKGLLLTQDMKTVIEIDKGTVKAFDLKDNDGNEYVFELLPGTNDGNFVERLVRGGKYWLYKSIKTKFVKADYVSDGLTERGNNYDEYLDETNYYLVDGNTKTAKKVELKKKSIKEACAMEGEKMQKYFSLHSDSDINEDFLKGLTKYLND